MARRQDERTRKQALTHNMQWAITMDMCTANLKNNLMFMLHRKIKTAIKDYMEQMLHKSHQVRFKSSGASGRSRIREVMEGISSNRTGQGRARPNGNKCLPRPPRKAAADRQTSKAARSRRVKRGGTRDPTASRTTATTAKRRDTKQSTGKPQTLWTMRQLGRPNFKISATLNDERLGRP